MRLAEAPLPASELFGVHALACLGGRASPVVTQIFNLLYRRIPFGSASKNPARRLTPSTINDHLAQEPQRGEMGKPGAKEARPPPRVSVPEKKSLSGKGTTEHARRRYPHTSRRQEALSLTPNFSWVDANRAGPQNRFQRFASSHRRRPREVRTFLSAFSNAPRLLLPTINRQLTR